MAAVSRPAKAFTPKQGQYLAFIHLYTRLHRRPPAETDMQQYFRVSPPSVHQMVLTLERAGFITRQPRVPAASNYSLIQSTCQSYFDHNPTCQNHRAAVLDICAEHADRATVGLQDLHDP
ncbi:MAG: MarR family winged helix-turn-helix transcriptional regulator, partial [Methyloceanibacter sp.]